MMPQYQIRTNQELCRVAVEAEPPKSCATLDVPSPAFSHLRSDGVELAAVGHDDGGDVGGGDVAAAVEMGLQHCYLADLGK